MPASVRKIAAILVLLFLTTSAAWAADPAAKAFLDGIYAAYFGEESTGIWYTTEEEARAWFTPETAALIGADMKESEEEGSVGRLDFDPFINGQDWLVESADVQVQETGPDTAIGEARFNNYDRANVVRYALVKTADGWRIDDIRWNDYEFSLREILQTSTD